MDGPGERLHEVLRGQVIRAWRLHLETPGVRASVPLLSGVWGRALHEIDASLYDAVFEGGEGRVPRYWLRPAPADARPAPAVEFALLGPLEPSALAPVWEAWDRAAHDGLGPHRAPFRIRAARPLAWDATPLAPARDQPGFPLDGLPWPGGPAACRLEFPAPLRLVRDGLLIESPTLPDLVLAGLRRLHGLAGAAADGMWADRHAWLEAARAVPARPWTGRRLDLVRYSGSQHRELEMRGVSGALELPEGPGPLAPLLAAAAWTHLGKATVMGLGQMVVAPCRLDPSRRSWRT
jgi:hypothetical protein